ncbi:MAG: hypothetical protein IT270_01950 [Saprospiraceae bacterium]|nr:hypothetical protein [Saprospiraceae bacterium]
MKTNIKYTCLLFLLSTMLCSCGGEAEKPANTVAKTNLVAAAPADAVPNALPFTMSFELQSLPGSTAFPRLQSYASAITNDGQLVFIGGRRQGLHTFMSAPANNFVRDSANHFIYIIDPKSGSSWSFDVNGLPATMSAPLSATNMQSFYDRATDQMYIVGGYGWKADGSNMVTFNTLFRFKLEALVSAIKSKATPDKIASLIQMAQDDRFAVTGGELILMGGKFYLVFGQIFNGQYRAFGGTDFTQEYTEEVRVFTLNPTSLKILSYGANTNTEPDQPFHRRDGNIVEDIDPATGSPRIATYGGVFQPGAIAPYTYPVFITGPSAPKSDRSGNQKFSQYECPVIAVYDSTGGGMYNTFFGGIGHYYYFQTDSQAHAYQIVTAEGRNDGFPFVADITTFQQSPDGSYNEFIHTSPIPGNRLLGTSIPFIVHPDLLKNGLAYDNGTIKLAGLTGGQRVLIGYIYGGIEAVNPLPLIPNTGTMVSNSLFAVYLTKTPSAAYPASKGHESIKNETNLKRK